MGVSLAAAGAILLVGGFYNLSVLGAAYLNTSQRTRDALLDAELHLEAVRQGEVSITSVEFTLNIITQEGNTSVFVENLGPITYNATEVDLMIDGAYYTTWIDVRRVDGVDTAVWAPKTDLRLTILCNTVFDPGCPAALPDRAIVATATGTWTFWDG